MTKHYDPLFYSTISFYQPVLLGLYIIHKGGLMS